MMSTVDAAIFWRMVLCLSGLLGALVGALTNSFAWGLVALFATLLAPLVTIYATIGVLTILDAFLVKSGFYRWRAAKRVAKAKERREALRRG